MREKLQERLCAEEMVAESEYAAVAKREIVDSFAFNTTLSDERIAKLLDYKGNLVNYLYSLFIQGEDVFASAVQEKLDAELGEVEAISAF